MRQMLDVEIAMRDGTVIVGDVFLLDVAGRHPTLVGMSPYGKEIQWLNIHTQPPTSAVYAREELAEIVDGLREDRDLQQYPSLYNLALNPNRLPGFFDVLANPLDGPYYWERSPYTRYEQIGIPRYAGSGWWAYAHMHLRGAFRHYAAIDAPKKLYIESRVEADAPMDEAYNAEVVRWYEGHRQRRRSASTCAVAAFATSTSGRSPARCGRSCTSGGSAGSPRSRSRGLAIPTSSSSSRCSSSPRSRPSRTRRRPTPRMWSSSGRRR